jgi:hypothetical protein
MMTIYNIQSGHKNVPREFDRFLVQAICSSILVAPRIIRFCPTLVTIAQLPQSRMR